MVEWGPFDPIVLTAILLNCGTMAWESPLDEPGTMKSAIVGAAEWIFLFIFTFEMFTKILAYGFAMHKGSYLRDPWCQLDFVVVTMAWLPILYPALGNYSVLRAFRALRPLRALKRLPGMPVLVQWILDVMPKMGSVFGLCSFMILVFGIVGMELFKGSLHYRCARSGFTAGSLSQDEEDFDTRISCNPNREDQCIDGTSCEFFHSNPNDGTTSFDSVGMALITLVQAITFDDWANPMFRLSSSFSESVWIYFVLLVMLGGYFILNLFLAVIFLEYEETKKRMANARAEAADEEEGEEAVPMLAESIMRSDTPVGHRLAAQEEDQGPQSCLTTIATSSTLNNASTFLVLLNIVLMCMPYEGMTPAYASRLEKAATAITWSFIAEMVVKLLGLGCEGYWSDQWNVRKRHPA